jgi:hypothetical protein
LAAAALERRTQAHQVVIGRHLAECQEVMAAAVAVAEKV